MSLPLPGYQLSTREDIEPLLFLPRRDMSLCARLREVARHESVNEFEAFEQTIGRGIFDKRIKTRRDKQRDGEKEEENPIKSLSAGSQSRPGVTKKKKTHVVSAGCTSPRRSLQSTSCSPPTSNMIAVHCAARGPGSSLCSQLCRMRGGSEVEGARALPTSMEISL